jgi:aminopeptidase N
MAIVVSFLPNLMIMKRNYLYTISLSIFLCLPLIDGVAQEYVLDNPDGKSLEISSRKSLSKLAVFNENPLLDNYDVKFYKLDVEANTESDYIAGSTTVLVEVVNSPLSTLVLELTDLLSVSEVFIDGVNAGFLHESNEINITMPSQAAVGELVSAEVHYYGVTGPGMFTGDDPNWNVPVTATLSEPFNALDWFPCKQDLQDKADSVYVFITTDYGLTGVSNGLLTGTTYLPNGKTRYEWKSNYPIDYYLISIAIADYEEYNITATPAGMDPILIQNFVYAVDGCLEFYKEKIDATIDIMELYCDLFGPYPFGNEKYGHYLWPWGGGMEHQTMTGMGNFEFYLISHELGHSWFGDYITCATWNDIWINEGFATYTTYLAKEFLHPEIAEAEKELRFERAMREDEGTVYIPLGTTLTDGRIFSGNLSYSKGSTLLHMIRYEMDDDALFFQMLKDYVEIYGDSVATGMDFKAVLEDVSGMDFTDFFDQWYFGAGYPTFDVSWEQVGQTVTIYSNQTSSSAITTLFKMPMEYKLLYAGGDTTVRVAHEVNDEVYTFDLNHAITGVVLDPGNHVVNKQSAVKRLAGIDKHEQKFSIFPNPNGGLFNMELLEGATGELGVEVYNSLNQLIYYELIEQVSPFSTLTIDLGSQAEGLYLVRISCRDKYETQKIIIK